MTATQEVKTVPEVARIKAKAFVHPVELYVMRDRSGGFWSCAPQLPGVVSQGETAADALVNVQEALREAVQSYRDDGEEIPWAPRVPPEEYARANPEDRDSGWAIVDMR